MPAQSYRWLWFLALEGRDSLLIWTSEWLDWSPLARRAERFYRKYRICPSKELEDCFHYNKDTAETSTFLSKVT